MGPAPITARRRLTSCSAPTSVGAFVASAPRWPGFDAGTECRSTSTSVTTTAASSTAGSEVADRPSSAGGPSRISPCSPAGPAPAPQCRAAPAPAAASARPGDLGRGRARQLRAGLTPARVLRLPRRHRRTARAPSARAKHDGGSALAGLAGVPARRGSAPSSLERRVRQRIPGHQPAVFPERRSCSRVVEHRTRSRGEPSPTW